MSYTVVMGKKCHICPWWLAFTFDNPLRRLFHKPQKLLFPYVRAGMDVLDIGCGMGYFSIAMAKIVGPEGSVTSVDVQDRMLDAVKRRAARAGVHDRINLRSTDVLDIGELGEFDFALAFWVVHEIPDQAAFFKLLRPALRPSGKLLIAEPLFHVKKAVFASTLLAAQDAGFVLEGAPSITFSRSALLG